MSDVDDVSELKARFDSLHEDVLLFIKACPVNAWRNPTALEGWRAGVTAHHIGAIHYPVIDQAQAIIDHQPLTVATMADVDRLNEQHVQTFAECSPAETLEFLEREGNRVRDWLAALKSDDLARTADVPFMGGSTTAGRMLQVVLIDLAAGHLESARAAAGMGMR